MNRAVTSFLILVFCAFFSMISCEGESLLQGPERNGFSQNKARDPKVEGSDSGTYVGNGNSEETGIKSLQLTCVWTRQQQQLFRGDCSLNLDSSKNHQIRWAFREDISDALIVTPGPDSARASVILPSGAGLSQVELEIFIDQKKASVSGSVLDLSKIAEQADGLSVYLTGENPVMLLIEKGAEYTAKNPVTLSVYSGGAESYYITNNPLCDGDGVWKSIRSETTWRLPRENQEVSIYMRLRYADGTESECFSDSVIHDNQAPARPLAFDDGVHTLSLSRSPLMSWRMEPPEPGVVFEMSLGSLPGGEDLMPWIITGESFATQIDHLNLESGITVYPKIRSVDRAGNRSVTTFGDGFQVGLIGTPDRNFQDMGFALVESDRKRNYNSTEVQADGKILLTGTSKGEDGETRATVWRFLENGEADPGFVSPALPSPENQGICDFPSLPRDIHTLPDKRILVTGGYSDCDRIFGVLWKLTPDGNPDEAFGNLGMVSLKSLGFREQSSDLFKVIHQNDGKILLGGYLRASRAEFPALIRLRQDGTLDTKFGINGVFTIPVFDGSATPGDIWLNQDGKIYMAYTVRANRKDDARVVRITPDGNRDLLFARAGEWTLAGKGGPWTRPAQFTPLGKGGFIVAGQNCRDDDDDSVCKWEVLKVAGDGNLRTEFGRNGILRGSEEFSHWPGLKINSLTADADGKIVISSRYCSDDEAFMTVLRLDAIQGRPDFTFGNSGLLTLPQHTVNCSVNTRDRIVSPSEGKLFLSGFINSSLLGFWRVL